jgi:hypothetical protein
LAFFRRFNPYSTPSPFITIPFILFFVKLVTASFDEEVKGYKFVVPEMDVEGKEGTSIIVDIALNGQQFTGSPLELQITKDAAPPKGKPKGNK